MPEWVNLAAVDERDGTTIVELVCPGRLTHNEDLRYHVREGAPPFHMLGPTLPARLIQRELFSIHHRAECWSAEDAVNLARHADKVWSLNLCTCEFDENGLSRLPALGGVKIFEHRMCTLGAGALSPFRRFPSLRVLRLRLTTSDRFSVAGRHRLSRLDKLTIDNLPQRSGGSASCPNKSLGSLL